MSKRTSESEQKNTAASLSESFQSPIGTHDLTPPQSDRWLDLLKRFAESADRANFGYLQTPIFEDVGVFARIGEETEMVGKEMYEFADRSDRRLALRPEGTASVCRAFVQQHPVVPWKVWYQGPFFRYEAPQAGRYRQFHQIGAETLGTDDPDADVEIIALADDFFTEIGLTKVDLLVNSMGDADTRSSFNEALSIYLSKRVDDVDPEDRDKIERHPLRILDSKRRATIRVADEAPQITDFLSADTAAHFECVCEGLNDLDIPYRVEPKLVRGLDYYTRTTFEFRSTELSTAQNAICGGGRYNGLVEALSGPPTPGIGFATGIERLLLACEAEDAFGVQPNQVQVWVIDTTGDGFARSIAYRLRSAGIKTDRAFDDRSMRAQIRAADRSGAQVAVIVGPDEAASDTVTVRPLRSLIDGSDLPQRTVPDTELFSAVEMILGTYDLRSVQT